MKEELNDEMILAIASYRLQRAIDTIQEAVDLLEKDHFNASVNRLYYACYYAVSALLIKNKLFTTTHSGTKQMFGMNFILTNKLDRKFNITYSELFDKRHSGDYDDFLTFDRETVERLIPESIAFIDEIKSIL